MLNAFWTHWQKFKNSNVKHGYLLHLARPEGGSQNGVEEYIRTLIEKEANRGPRIAYVNVGNEETLYRRLGEAVVTC